MLSAPFERIIGRHGLVSERKLLWKVGVQPTQNYLEKYVDAFPQYAQVGSGKRRPLKVIHPFAELYPDVTRVKRTGLSTATSTLSTDQISELCSVSTEPTITTTIYINRRGAAQ